MTEKARRVAKRKPPANIVVVRKLRRPSARGYEAQSGRSRSEANFVQEPSARKNPRAGALFRSQNPQIRSAGMSASFELEFETYCVKGYAAHAKASVAPSRMPPNRLP